MILETNNAINRFNTMHLQMISKVETCLCKLRDTTTSKRYLRIHADNGLLSEVQIERNMLVALLGELNASMKHTAMLDVDSVVAMQVFERIGKLRQRVQAAEQHFMHTYADVEQVLRKAS